MYVKKSFQQISALQNRLKHCRLLPVTYDPIVLTRVWFPWRRPNDKSALPRLSYFLA